MKQGYFKKNQSSFRNTDLTKITTTKNNNAKIKLENTHANKKKQVKNKKSTHWYTCKAGESDLRG